MDADHTQERNASAASISTPKSHGLLGNFAFEHEQEAQKLSHATPQEGQTDVVIEARFVTPCDSVLVTAEQHRLPGVPIEEAHKLNELKESLADDGLRSTSSGGKEELGRCDESGESSPSSEEGLLRWFVYNDKSTRKATDGDLRTTQAASYAHPLFPPMPLYGPPSILRNVQCMAFRTSSFFLSTAFLGVIMLGSLFACLPPYGYRIYMRLTSRDPDAERPFYVEEQRRQEIRKIKEKEWRRRLSDAKALVGEDKEGTQVDGNGVVQIEGRPDLVVCDIGYYARCVGLDVEELQVQTEDGFIIDLWHVYDPKEYSPLPAHQCEHRGPQVFTEERRRRNQPSMGQKPKFPVLLMHGLMQSSGAYCVNEDDSLAFYLCKAGYDVWLGNNRCGFQPKHVLLKYADPRMWCWNIRQMGVFDLAALTSRVLYETGFEKIGLVCHSQGTTQTFVALAKEQRPELGEKLTVFCALAPAVYAGPLIGKIYFKFMRIISPGMFRMIFGIHAFIPLMMMVQKCLDARLYGWLGYKVFCFLFEWTDRRWDRAMKARMFQFAPVYVSAESMRWWLGRECFANHKCILATKEEWRAEEREEENSEEHVLSEAEHDMKSGKWRKRHQHRSKPRGATAWYNEQVPPFALWVCGNDDLVDGQRLLRRFERSGEPHVRVVHKKVIPEYEHLDVIWAMDAVTQVFSEVKDVLWKTCNVREQCRKPKACEGVEGDMDEGESSSGEQSSVNGYDGMQSISGSSISSSDNLV